MQLTTRPHATLVDLLDRVLDRGLVISADIIISVAGVPLIGINLRAALAGMETMMKYGVMQDWHQVSLEKKGATPSQKDHGLELTQNPNGIGAGNGKSNRD